MSKLVINYIKNIQEFLVDLLKRFLDLDIFNSRSTKFFI